MTYITITSTTTTTTATATAKQTRQPVNNDPWAVLIALASLIIVATITAIIVICILWKRYQKRRLKFEQSLYEFPVYEPQIQPRLQEYEIQSLDMYVPNDDRQEDLGEVHVGFSPREGIQSVHHVKELPLMQQQLPDQMISGQYQSKNNDFDYQQNSNESIKIKDTSLYQRVMHYSKLGINRTLNESRI